MKSFKDIIDEAVETFSNKIANFEGETVEIENGKHIVLSKEVLDKAVGSLLKGGGKKIPGAIKKHFDAMEGKLIFSSDPKGFRTAWNHRKSKTEWLTRNEAHKLAYDGCRFIPTIMEYKLLKHNQKGMIKSEFHDCLLQGVRHSGAVYDDKLDDEGRFNYHSPRTLKGMLRFRWLEHLAIEFKIPIFIYVTIWYKYRAFEDHSYNTLISPCVLIDESNKIDGALKLQVIKMQRGFQIIDELKALEHVGETIMHRPALHETIISKYNYQTLNTSKVGKEIKKFAKKTNRRCPGDYCGGVFFADLSDSEISFGHIIAQDWARSFTYMLNKVHHPDNLYLTCKSCNSSLGANFPDKKMVAKIVSAEFGTVGDWVRKIIK
ncbi:MAG: hypothetical protein CME64_01620 [Halobacteriovoraceae bacterium]|nr:hypothetical protein [Halobacteriovoraceae bacterium]